MNSFWKMLSDSLSMGLYLSKVAGEYTPRGERREKFLSALDEYMASIPGDGHRRRGEEIEAETEADTAMAA